MKFLRHRLGITNLD